MEEKSLLRKSELFAAWIFKKKVKTITHYTLSFSFTIILGGHLKYGKVQMFQQRYEKVYGKIKRYISNFRVHFTMQGKHKLYGIMIYICIDLDGGTMILFKYFVILFVTITIWVITITPILHTMFFELDTIERKVYIIVTSLTVIKRWHP